MERVDRRAALTCEHPVITPVITPVGTPVSTPMSTQPRGHVTRRSHSKALALCRADDSRSARSYDRRAHSPRQSQASQRAALCIGALGGTCTDDTVARERQQRAPQPARRRALVARGDLGAVLRARAHHVGAEGPAVRRARAIAAQRYEAIGADEIRRKVQRLQLCSQSADPTVREWQRWHARARIHSRAGADGCAANVGAGGEGQPRRTRAAHVSQARWDTGPGRVPARR